MISCKKSWADYVRLSLETAPFKEIFRQQNIRREQIFHIQEKNIFRILIFQLHQLKCESFKPSILNHITQFYRERSCDTFLSYRTIKFHTHENPVNFYSKHFFSKQQKSFLFVYFYVILQAGASFF